jgi:hypothetical protein
MGKGLEELQKDANEGKGISMLCLNGHDGYAWFGGGKVLFDSDGSGHVANGNIAWDAAGNAIFNGAITSNNDSGDRIVINPYTRNLQFIGSETGVSVTIGKNITFANPDIAYDSLIISSNSGSRSELTSSSLNVYKNGNKTFGTLSGVQVGFYYNRLEPDETGFEATVGSVGGQNKLIVILKNCPKSPNGLPVNTLWNDNGIIKIIE